MGPCFLFTERVTPVEKFYQESVNQITQRLNIDVNRGLTATQVTSQRERFGKNQLTEKKNDPYWLVFLKNFKEPIDIVLLGAALLSFLSAWYAFTVQNQPQHGREAIYEAVAILVLVLLNVFLGFWQKIKSRKSLDALREMNSRESQVLRDGEWQRIPTTDLVIGDVLKVTMGDFVEADVRWINVAELQVIESHLTGEADAIEKQTAPLTGIVETGDQTNMGFSGSTVANGQGTGIVVATGEHTELGHIAQLIQAVPPKKSPLQTTISRLTRTLMRISAGIVILTFIIGTLWAGELSLRSITNVLSTSIALAVASIPDALPAVLSIVLTIGAAKLARDRGLIKSLSSVETLGSTSYICSDKTGTLTKNEMTVTQFYDQGQAFTVAGRGYQPTGAIQTANGEMATISADSPFLQGALLCNEATIKKDGEQYRPFGNPTEVALTVLGHKAGLTKERLLADQKLVRTLPFTSSRKMMSVIVQTKHGYRLYTKGAPDVLTRHSAGILTGDQVDPSAAARQSYIKVVEDYASQALRTLAVGYRDLTAKEAADGDPTDLETDLILTGIAGIIDPPREEVKAAVKHFNTAHIEVVMITGDHAKTARAIAHDLGIVKSPDARVITGIELDKMSDQQLFDAVATTNVYARVTPEHKQRIVKQLQKRGQVVAMTGDGVNDAPALRVADIGIAMGITGTEVTKDSADLVLLDDKFTTIETSVKSGRTIYANIKNFMRHELTTNVAEVLSLLLGLLLFNNTIGHVSATAPTMTALMVLWVNMVSDALPSFSLGYDKAEADTMRAAPRDPNESILANHTWSRVLIRGTLMGALVCVGFYLAAKAGSTTAQAQTVAFLTLVYGQLWHVFDARSTTTLFRRNPFGNPHLVVAVFFAGITSFLVTVLPFFNLVMGTAALSVQLYLLVIFVPALPTLILSGLKELFQIKIW